MKKLLVIALIFLCGQAFSQTGKIRGTINDGDAGEPLFGATVQIKGTTTGSITDFDGKYSIDVAPGTYTVVISYVSFATQEITDVVVKEGQVTVIDRELKTQAIEGETFTVTATQARNTEAAITTFKRKSVNLVDGISSKKLQKTGDNNAAQALRRVTGVSIEGGKNVYVRGLGDRYTKTILNGIAIPGLDPDRNAVQVDIFPTNVVDNLIVYKTFSPDLPADFTGGMVDIVTKDFPETKLFGLSASFNFNPDMHFNSDFLTFGGYAADTWGNGAGERKNRLFGVREIPRPLVDVDQNSDLEKLSKGFDREMAAKRGSSLLNQRYALSYGNQIEGEKNTFGYLVSFGYNKTFTYYDDFEFNTYQRSDTIQKNDLELFVSNNGEVGTEEVLWNGLASISLKREKSKYFITAFHTQNGVKTATRVIQENTDLSQNEVTLDKTSLYYNQRSISNVLVGSKHQLNDKLELKMAVSPSLALNKEPDMRQTIFTIADDGSYTLAFGEGALINRTWRNLEEFNINGKADVAYEFNQWSGLKSKLKTGVYYLLKDRSFDVVEYNFRNIGQPDYSGDPNQLFTNEYLFDAEQSPITNEGIFVIGETDSANIYSSSQTVMAAYIMNELPIDSSFKVIYGARVEKAEMLYTGQRQTIVDRREDIFNNRIVLDELDILPAISAVYSLGKDKDFNIRSNYSRTLARPSFKEKSGAQIYDAITEITFIGDLDLVQTYINNFDLRFEKYLEKADIVSFSAFYKDFTNPIEIVAVSATSPDNITPRNVDKATVIGVEFEMKKNLEFISEKLKHVSFGTNITVAKSEVEMNEVEYQARLAEARVGETVETTRQFQGQAPFLINTYLGYGNNDKALDINLSYNVQGKSLAIVGIGRVPDVYNKPFHNVSMKISKGFGGGEEAYIKKHKISLSVRNLLNQKRQMMYDAYNAEDQIFRSFSEGRFVGIGYSYTF